MNFLTQETFYNSYNCFVSESKYVVKIIITKYEKLCLFLFYILKHVAFFCNQIWNKKKHHCHFETPFFAATLVTTSVRILIWGPRVCVPHIRKWTEVMTSFLILECAKRLLQSWDGCLSHDVLEHNFFQIKFFCLYISILLIFISIMFTLH